MGSDQQAAGTAGQSKSGSLRDMGEPEEGNACANSLRGPDELSIDQYQRRDPVKLKPIAAYLD